MGQSEKQNSLVRVILVLGFVITALACVIGALTYRSNIRRTYQNLVHVELTDFIENTRYSLHFGKDIESFYRMNEILTEVTDVIEDVDGLYVVSDDRQVLFATDGRELSGKVLSLSGANTVEGRQFYTGMPLTEDGSARLIARCSSKSILLRQSDYLFRFLIVCLSGFVITELLILLLWRALRGRRQLIPVLMTVLTVWTIILSISGGINAFRDYTDSIEETRLQIEESAYRDIESVKAMGVKEESVRPLDSYLQRYVDEIEEVESVTMDEEGNIVVTFRLYAQSIIFQYVLQALIFLAISFVTLAVASKLADQRKALRPAQPVNRSLTKGTSIKTRLQRMVLIISATALVVTSVFGVAVMMIIRSQSESALIVETQSNLTSLVKDKAALAESQLERYANYAEFFSSYLNSLYAHPENYRTKGKGALTTGEGEEYICTTIRRSPELNYSDYQEEIELSYQVSDVLYPFIREPANNIGALYWGDENGFMTIYDRKEESQDPNEIYDFWSSAWYTDCKKEREVIFTDIYNDAFGNGLTITCAAPYYDGDGNFLGVFGVDAIISDIYDEIVSLDMGDGAYAFLVDDSGNIISPDGESVPLSTGENLDDSAVERLLTSDGSVFERNGIYYTGAKVPSAGWTLCIHAPADLTLSTVSTIENEIITAIIGFVVVFAVILLVVAAIIQRFAAGIADPIIALGEDVARISGGNLDYQAEIRSDDEVAGLDVSILQDHLLGPILGIQDPKTDKRIDFVGGIRGLTELERRCSAAEPGQEPEMKVAFSMYPTSIGELFAVADAGRLMPPKSTWFEPKLRSGLVIHKLED